MKENKIMTGEDMRKEFDRAYEAIKRSVPEGTPISEEEDRLMREFAENVVFFGLIYDLVRNELQRSEP